MANQISDQTKARMAALRDLPDESIDLTDMPEQSIDWSTAVRGGLYRPRKQRITIMLDADVLDHFKKKAKGERGYQTAINSALREHVGRTKKEEAA